jgi:RNA recognition motif-containing protein
MKLYVGNLPYSVNDNVLRSTFEAYGAVESARVIADRETGQSKGFGFVEMADDAASSAMRALDGQQHGGRTLRVNEARPQEPRQGGGGRGGDRGYGGSSGYGRY